MPHKKSLARLASELNAAHKRIMQLKTDPKMRGKVIGARQIADCFTPTQRPDKPFDPTDPGEVYQCSLLLGGYKRQGYLRYVPLNKGGQGFEVSSEFLTDHDAIKTTVVDVNKNLASKLRPSYNTPLAFLTGLTNVAPSTSVSALVEFLKSPEGQKYEPLLLAKPAEPAPVGIAPAKLKAVNLVSICFRGNNCCQLQNCDLWQALQIGSALDTSLPEEVAAPVETQTPLEETDALVVEPLAPEFTAKPTGAPF